MDATTLARMSAAVHSSGLFRNLSPAVFDELVGLMEFRQVLGGQMVLREGDKADSLVFVVEGALRAARRGKDGRLLLYNQVHAGQCIGELGMLLQQPRAQDVIALRDSALALLSRTDYDALLQRHPLELNQAMLQLLYERLRPGSGDTPGPGAGTHSLVLLPLQGDSDISHLGQELAAALGACLGLSADRIAVMDWPARSLRQRINGVELSEGPPRVPEDQHLMLYLADPEDSLWTRFCVRQADQLVLVGTAGRDGQLSELERDLQADEPGLAYKRQHLVLLHHPDRTLPDDPAPWQRERELERVYPLRRGLRADTSRLARFLAGQAVGVVLGGGGARGFAHLGVMRALEECGIAVDLLGGNSMGALIGAQLACDHSLEQVLEQTRVFASGGERPTLPMVALVSGARVRRDLRRMFGERLITQLWRPYFAAACNLSRGETTVLDKGPLWRAVLASNSPAGLLPPVLLNGELLVDGAILENVPVQPMRMRLGTPLERRRGNGLVIAIDVDVREQLRADPELHYLTPTSTLRHKFSRGAPVSPSIADILYSAGHVGGMAQRSRTVAQADHYLEPPVADIPMMAYARGAEIAERGYRYAMEQMERWERRQQQAKPQ